MFSRSSIAVLNHLLAQNGWALPRLAKFAGRTARFDIAPFSFACTVMEDGRLRTADADSIADAVCVLAPSLLPRLALSDESAHAAIETSGDSELLKEIFFLSRNLSWDAAEDLSRVTGDIAAERIVAAARDTRLQLGDAALNFSRAVAEYLTEERPMLAKPRHVAAFVQQVDALRDDLARLEQRIDRLRPGKST